MQKDELEIVAALRRNTTYEKLEYLDRGGTGVIYVSEIAKDEKRIIKVLRPDIASKKTAEAFREESRTLIGLSTPNIIKGIDLGEVEYGKINLPFLVMEYFPHKNLDQQRKKIWDKDWDIVLEVFHQVLKGLAALHERSICHLDIKERNILLDFESGMTKLLDLGSAKSTSGLPGKTRITGTFVYWPEEWQTKLQSSKYQIRGTSIVLPRAEITPDVDMHMLSVTISKVIKSAPARLQDTTIYRRVELFAERMNWDNRKTTVDEERYLNARQALEDWHKVSTQRSLPAVLKPQDMIRLPILSVTHLNKKTRAIINLPWVLRLKNVLQLATTHLVYPGAKHDRYEHSLGVYENTLRYLEALFTNNNSVWPSIFLDDEDCIYLALAALLHDVGHYPFAHQVEELEEAPSPDQISYMLLAGNECPLSLKKKYTEILTSNRLRDKYGDPATIRTAIEEFGIDYRKFLAFLAYCYGINFKPKGTTTNRNNVPRKWSLLASILSGPIDADKFDYIQRDSWHCGTKFGRGMDEERFFISLTPNIGNRVDLAVTDKGRTTVEQLLDSRYQMFSEVYWHHTVRAFTAMVRQILMVALERKLLGLPDLLSRSEAEIVEVIMSRCSGSKTCPARKKKAVNQIGKAILERKPYLRLWTINSEGDDEEIYQELTANRQEFYKDTFTWSNALKSFKGLSLSSDLIWDIPKPEKDKVGMITILTKEGTKFTLSKRLRTLSENFESSVRKIRLFIAPKYRPDIEDSDNRKRLEGELRTELKRHLGIR